MNINAINFEDVDISLEETQERPHQFNPAEYAYRGRAPEIETEQPGSSSGFDEKQEPPLLEELGIDPSGTKKRLFQVFKLGFGTDKQLFEDTDLSGPVLIVVLFGVFLMLVLLII